MRRRGLPFLIACAAALAAAPAAARTDPAAQDRALEAWWGRQREKEASDRFWNGPRERRRDLTRDQIERWERERNFRRYSPYSPYRGW